MKEFVKEEEEKFTSAMSNLLFDISSIANGDNDVPLYDRIGMILRSIHEMTNAFEQVVTSYENLKNRKDNL